MVNAIIVNKFHSIIVISAKICSWINRSIYGGVATPLIFRVISRMKVSVWKYHYMKDIYQEIVYKEMKKKISSWNIHYMLKVIRESINKLMIFMEKLIYINLILSQIY